MQIDHNNNIPIYEQIYRQILEYITKELLRPNDKLPSVRELSSSIHINPNTVVKAYHLLEEQGFIYSIPGKGSFVNSNKTLQNELFNHQIEELSKEIVAKSKYLGMTFEQLCLLLEQKWEE